MKIEDRIRTYFKTKSPFRITTDLLLYLLILSLLIPFSRKFVATGMNRLTMHRPAIIREASQVSLEDADFEWILMGPEGNSVAFKEFKDDVIFLSIWATWCPPCRAEMPNIQQLYEGYGDRIRFVLASQEEPEIIHRFMEDHGYSMPVYRLVQNPPSILSTSSIPTTFLIDRGGKIHVRKTGAARWNGKFFRAYLDKMLSS